MGAEKLKQRLKENATKLRLIVESLSSIPSPSLHTDCMDEIRKFEAMANQFIEIIYSISWKCVMMKLMRL